jgi:hypothetical protein
MSWLFSQALVEEYLGGGYLDGEQSAPSSGNPTQLAYLPPDRMTDFSRLSRFGMTFRPLTADRGAELLMSYLEAFHAKTFPVLDEAQELKAVDQVCGSTWHELSMKYDLDTHSWRTHQCLWDEALPWSSVILPKWGMTVSGVLFQHPTAERPISETGSGLWPTPTCNMVSGGANHNSPQVLAKNHGINLAGAVQKWPTPTANEDACGKPTGKMQKMLGNHPLVRQDLTGGTLNPVWVEWLMGWPLGWTDLKPLEMDRFQSWQQQHSGFYQEQQSND